MKKLLMISVLALGACTDALPTYQKIEGQTMGTSYHITYKAPDDKASDDIKQAIDARLADINASMSTYDKASTISKFNALKAGETISIDPDFIKVLSDSRVIYEKSEHAFDPTVYPLVQLWGFGAGVSVERLQNPPSTHEINAVRQRIGLDKVKLDGNQLSKTTDGVGLDFSAIAKGYGVDAIAQLLQSHHINDYLIEIGGEVATGGVNEHGKAWTLAIDKPIMGSDSTTREVMTTVQLSGQSMATSGNYRNFITHHGKTYSHTINPSTAHPVEGSFDSVSIIADTTALADGWATALSAIPSDDALAMANKHQINAIFIKNTQSEPQVIYSSAHKSPSNP